MLRRLFVGEGDVERWRGRRRFVVVDIEPGLIGDLPRVRVAVAIRTDCGELATVKPLRRAATVSGSGFPTVGQVASPAPANKAAALRFGQVATRV